MPLLGPIDERAMAPRIPRRRDRHRRLAQAAADLVQWSPVTTVTNLNGTLVFTDYHAANLLCRFYLLVMKQSTIPKSGARLYARRSRRVKKRQRESAGSFLI